MVFIVRYDRNHENRTKVAKGVGGGGGRGENASYRNKKKIHFVKKQKKTIHFLYLGEPLSI